MDQRGNTVQFTIWAIGEAGDHSGPDRLSLHSSNSSGYNSENQLLGGSALV